MSPEYGEALDRGLAALGLPVDAAARAMLEKFADRLLAWNARVNLTAVTDPAELAEKHFVDSLALLPLLGPARTLLDVGSGAGLPGMAVACRDRTTLPRLQAKNERQARGNPHYGFRCLHCGEWQTGSVPG